MDLGHATGWDRLPTSDLDMVCTAVTEADAAPSDAPAVAAPRARLACRQLRESDVEAAISLLATGFPERSEDYWRDGFVRLRARIVPEGLPRYGYGMRDGERLVGVILLIVAVDADGIVRGNMSSWYVDPAYRGFSAILAGMPIRLRGATLFNISPAPDTRTTIEAQGFQCYVTGTFHALPCLAPRAPGATVRVVKAVDEALAPEFLALREAGCICLEVSDGDTTHPFAFVTTRIAMGRLRAAQLVFCRDTADFVRFAGILGPALLRQGFASVTLDANGPIAGVPGLFRAGRRVKYHRGPNPPRLNDLRETELVIFGP